MLKQQMASAQSVEEYAGCGEARTCLAGLYLLTGQGTLARFDAAGDLTVDAGLTAGLSFRLQAVLSQYRSGAVEGLSLGLIADTRHDQKRGTGSLIFNDRVVNELLATGGEVDRPLTTHERRSRTRTVCQGLRLLLNRNRPQQARVPGYCPVLFVPEADCETLRERYGVDVAVNRALFEVLDLSSPFAPNRRLPRELRSMVWNMRRAQLEAGSSQAPVTAANEPAVEAVSGVEAEASTGAEPGPRGRARGELAPPDSCFNDGDAVTGWLLEWFSPFNELTDMQREIIAGYQTIRKTKNGTCLIEQGTRDDICVYLVEGSLALKGPDGGTMIINAGTRRSRLPISVLVPHVYDVTAVTDASIIVFSQNLVRRIIEIATTYTSVDPLQEPAASTAAISNGAQAAYLNRA